MPATVGSAAGTTRRAGMARGDGLVSRSKPSADDFELTFDPVEAPVASSRILVMSACMRLSSSGLMRDFEYYRIAGFFLLDVVQQFDAFVADEAVPGRGYQASSSDTPPAWRFISPCRNGAVKRIRKR